MDIKELENFKLSDAVKFHNKLNPALWDNEKLQPEVREQLLTIAKDLISTLGVDDLAVKDIQISGSNAAYSYTPHSDLDLHVVVDMTQLPDDKIYKELFNAKKTIYNDKHDITVHNVPVELYVQDVNEPHVSLGEYSVLNDKWTKYPKKARAHFNQYATKAKFENLKELVELALRSQDLDRVSKVIDIIKRYRKAGLAKGGEFGPENLAYKAIRTQGGIDDLYHLRDILHSEKLSIEESVNTKQDAINKILKMRNIAGRSPEEIKTINNIIRNLVSRYDIKPNEIEKSGSNIIPFSVQSNTPNTLDAKIATAAYNKNLARQALEKEWQKTKDKIRGIFAEDTLDETVQDNKDLYTVSKSIADYLLKAIKNKKNFLRLYVYNTLFPNVYNTLFPNGGKKGSEMSIPKVKNYELNYVANNTNYQVYYDKKDVHAWYEPETVTIKINMPHIEELAKRYPLKTELITVLSHELQHAYDDLRSDKRALPKPYKSTEKVDYEKNIYSQGEINARFQEAMIYLGAYLAKRHVSTLDKNTIRQMLPITIKHALNRNDLVKYFEKDDPRYKRLLSRAYQFFMSEIEKPSFDDKMLDKPETFLDRATKFILGNPVREDVAEASGYIPSEKEKNDPRFKTALTVDVKPYTMKNNAMRFGNKISRAGIPPQARPDGKIK